MVQLFPSIGMASGFAIALPSHPDIPKHAVGQLTPDRVRVEAIHFGDVSMAAQLRQFVKLVLQKVCSHLYLDITKITSRRSEIAASIIHDLLSKDFGRGSKRLHSWVNASEDVAKMTGFGHEVRSGATRV